jgi:hypothetical protein
MLNKLNPEHPIPGTHTTVGDFWSWAYSDILSNRNRSIFAEFLVGAALDVLDKPRIEWNAWDLMYYDRMIEVKSASYLQSWVQKRLSDIRFDIGSKLSWNYDTNEFISEKTRTSYCYVFCLYAEKDRLQVNIFNLDMWQFYVVATSQINERFKDQKSVSLKNIEALSGQPVNYANLRLAVDSILS